MYISITIKNLQSIIQDSRTLEQWSPDNKTTNGTCRKWSWSSEQVSLMKHIYIEKMY